MATKGYPGAYGKGSVISGLEAATSDNCKVFHAGTAEQEGAIVTSGGRVLCVTALGETIGEAQAEAYRGAGEISWEGAVLRRDIGWRAIDREQAG